MSRAVLTDIAVGLFCALAVFAAAQAICLLGLNPFDDAPAASTASPHRPAIEDSAGQRRAGQ